MFPTEETYCFLLMKHSVSTEETICFLLMKHSVSSVGNKVFSTKETLLSPGARRLRVLGGRGILTEDDAERFSVLSAVRRGAGAECQYARVGVRGLRV